jgi:bis(5'-nucleosyl)-tetraphosphatase (symmetrical)
MAVYWAGDIQGCNASLGRLLGEVDFSPSRDQLIVLGDLVNRGPDSAGVLRRLMALQGSVQCVLGNHDLHALAVAFGFSRTKRLDTLDDLMNSPDRDILINWLRQQQLALWSHDVLSVHAGVLPDWTLAQTLSLADEVQSVLRGPDLPYFLAHMYGNEPNTWCEDLTDMARWRVVVNALTRLRFCSDQGTMEFATKDSSAKAPEGFMPWFDVPGRRTSDITIAFGHWSTLGWQDRNDIWALDTGCVWGGCLSAMRQDENGQRQRVQVACEQAQIPQ